LLGQADFRLDGESISGFYSSKAQALLVYLAVTGVPHSRAALAGLLWSDMPEADARTNLRQGRKEMAQQEASNVAGLIAQMAQR